MKTLREAYNDFLAFYRTEGCSDPKCHVCKRSRAAKQEMDRVVEVYMQKVQYAKHS